MELVTAIQDAVGTLPMMGQAVIDLAALACGAALVVCLMRLWDE